MHAMWHHSIGSAIFLVSLFALVWCLQALLLLLLPSRRAMLAATSALFILASASSYFSTRYGIVMNKDMLRNVFETDVGESRSLLSFDLIERILLLGVVPAMLVWRIRLPAMRWRTRLSKHAFASLGALCICAFALGSAPASYAVFFREHKPIRYSLLPAAPLTSAIGVLMDKRNADGPLINASGNAYRIESPHPKPLVIVMIVGETARAANFQLGGYARPTNPELSGTPGIVYFSNIMSCGTATAISVPCMFSHFPRSAFDVDEAERHANLLDAAQAAGFAVEWRDNNSGCKGVCARVMNVTYDHSNDAAVCRESHCYDEVMIADLPERLATLTQDTLIVMHQIGSHGPAYAERYPPQFEKFKPACHVSQLQRCTAEEVVNAYDNTIAYTDHMIARTIATLRDSSDSIDAMLLYVSDHGESLGEQGMYLHGLPYAFAPEVQKHVPMLMWLSPEYAARTAVGIDCLAAHAAQPSSHDNVYHTLLGAAQIRNDSYDAALDILAACRRPRWPANHE
jgi:lipid A ethanolaminephosphotransferase